jgi:hypothetical protein
MRLGPGLDSQTCNQFIQKPCDRRKNAQIHTTVVTFMLRLPTDTRKTLVTRYRG